MSVQAASLVGINVSITTRVVDCVQFVLCINKTNVSLELLGSTSGVLSWVEASHPPIFIVIMEECTIGIWWRGGSGCY